MVQVMQSCSGHKSGRYLDICSQACALSFRKGVVVGALHKLQVACGGQLKAEVLEGLVGSVDHEDV